MKNFFALLILVITLSNLHAQTNVSGGIYTNTTWTLANSPYIVVDTVVVFPGVRLTIEPGVVVKFEDGIRLEIRQAQLIANGTAIDSITFTSNSAAPTPGIWDEIWNNGGTPASQFNYCNIEYAKIGIYNHQLVGVQNSTTEMSINNSKFSNNIKGVSGHGNGGGFSIVDTSIFENNTNGFYGSQFQISFCNIHSNQTGIFLEPTAGTYAYITNSIVNLNQNGLTGNAATGASFYSIKNSTIDSNTIAGIVEGDYPSYVDTILNCELKNNTIAVLDSFGGGMLINQCVIESNTIGLKLKGVTNKQIHCNKICSNTLWNVYYNLSFGSNFDMTNNDWCTIDSATIDTMIYDGYDNINLGLVHFQPVDMSQCYLTGCLLGLTAHVTNATCDTCHNGSATAIVSNGFAPYIYTWYTAPLQTTQTATGLASGTYTLCVTDGHGCSTCDSTIFIDSTNCTGFAMTANATNATCIACNDGSAWINVIGGTQPYYYTWYTAPIQTTDTASNLLNGTYAVCATDLYGCSVCDSVTIGVGSCSAHFNLYPDTVLHSYIAVNMASGVSPITYDWDWGDGSVHDTSPFPSHVYASAGTYTICLSITDSVGCTNTYCNSFYLQRTENTMIYVNVIPLAATGIKEPLANIFAISPNPATNQFTITSAFAIKEISIYNVLGEKVYSKQMTNDKGQMTIDATKFGKGIYFVRVDDGERRVVRKLVVE